MLVYMFKTRSREKNAKNLYLGLFSELNLKKNQIYVRVPLGELSSKPCSIPSDEECYIFFIFFVDQATGQCFQGAGVRGNHLRARG